MGEVAALLASVFGDGDDDERSERRRAAQGLGESAATTLGMDDGQLVYGELDVRSVAEILDAAGVEEGDRFLDIGSGEGLPTMAAALLYPERFVVCRGIEVVPALALRARAHARYLRDTGHAAATIELLEGDVYEAARAPDSAIAAVLRDSTLALCFATTWSHEPRRTLPRLSETLARVMPAHSRVVLVDARLVQADGWRWEGDLRIRPPDTAPHSTARLYVRSDSR